MYTKILILLDGSELAESVLPYAKWFTEVSKVNEIVFLRVVEPFHVAGGLEANVLPGEKGRIENDAAGIARKYLDKITGRFEAGKIKVSRVVDIGKPAGIIKDYVTRNDVDLIIMATHGISGIKRMVLGSVADEIIRTSHVPVFLVTPRDRPPDQPK
jgi:nucleotide-binding universal stress UspA family protein